MEQAPRWWWMDSAKLACDFRRMFPDETDRILKNAEQISRRIFSFTEKWEMEQVVHPVQFSGAVEWDQVPRGDPEWVFALNRHTCFLTLGHAYLLTGNRVWYDVFAELLQDWKNRVPLTPESTKTTWRTIEAGIRCENWIRAYCCFNNGRMFSGAVSHAFFDSLQTHAAYLERVDDDFRVLSNWGVLQNHGLFLLGVFLREPRYTEKAISRLQRELSMQILPDGIQWEQSPMYHCEVLRCCLDVLSIAERNHIFLPRDFTDTVHRMTRSLAAWCRPDGCLPCQSDSDRIDARDLLVQGAVLFRDGVLKHGAGPDILAENLWDMGESAFAFHAIPEEVPEQLCAAFPESGNYVLRGGAEEHAYYLRFHCGCMGSGHGHADLLHFDLCARGEDILIDSGRYTYRDGPDRRNLKAPAAHNTVRVDGQDFSQVKNSWDYTGIAMPVKGEYRFGKIAAFLSGGHLGYMELPAGPIFVSRRVVWVKPEITVVCDSFYGSGHHLYEQYFHFGDRGEVTIHPGGAEYRGEHAAAQLFFFPPEIQTEQQESDFSLTYNQLRRGTCLKNTWNSDGFTSLITVIRTADKAEDADVSVTELPVYLTRDGRRLESNQAQGIRIVTGQKETVVLFCHRELIAEVGFFRVGAYKGYGKTVVFTSDHPDGECLQW